MKKIFIICPVTQATDKEKTEILNYVTALEKVGYLVHYPYRDTPQNEIALTVNRINTKKIRTSDEVHIFYKSKSKGIHFDLGHLFSLKELHKNKIISFILRLFGIKNPCVVIIKNQKHTEEKGYTKMLEQWINE